MVFPETHHDEKQNQKHGKKDDQRGKRNGVMGLVVLISIIAPVGQGSNKDKINRQRRHVELRDGCAFLLHFLAERLGLLELLGQNGLMRAAFNLLVALSIRDLATPPF